MYCVNGESGSSLLIESTDSMITYGIDLWSDRRMCLLFVDAKSPEGMPWGMDAKFPEGMPNTLRNIGSGVLYSLVNITRGCRKPGRSISL